MHAAGPLPSPSLLHLAADEAAAAMAESREDADSREAMQCYNNLAFFPAPPLPSPGAARRICSDYKPADAFSSWRSLGVTHAESDASAGRTQALPWN